jgi:hypothetical protein
MKNLLRSILILCIASADAWATAKPDHVFCVHEHGAKGDAKTDDTAAFQKALDAAGAAGGGTVRARRGNYLFEGQLSVPTAVTLEGIWSSVPSHIGYRNKGYPVPTDHGTTFLVTGNAGTEEAPPFITLNHNSTLRGVVLYHPNQISDDVPIPYPWAIAMRGKNPAVLDVELLNPYNGIDASRNERHLIRNVQGQPLRRGIHVDAIYDIGRIENVHFNPWWSMKPKLFQWQLENGEAFTFGRSDWQYVLNTFCYGYKVGYKFIMTKAGLCNGNFLGIGADDCSIAVLVEHSAPMGVLITNGEFVSFRGSDPVMVVVKETNVGSIRFVNSAFWGPCRQIARIAGQGTVGFSDCIFAEWDGRNEGLPAILSESGSLIVRGSEFQRDKAQIKLGEKVRRAVISDNLITGTLRIENKSKGSVQIHGNAVDRE